MKIGFDLDGVLANFTDSFAAILTRHSGVTFPQEGPDWPQVWHWEYEELVKAGLSQDTIRDIVQAAWEEVNDPRTQFWATLAPLSDVRLGFVQKCIEDGHEVYFITSRPGLTAKEQTEKWGQVHFEQPINVIVSSEKGKWCKTLGLDVYVDDRGENIIDVEHTSPLTRAYLLNRPYNSHFPVTRRLNTLTDLLFVESL